MIALVDGDVVCYHSCVPRYIDRAPIIGDTLLIELGEDGKPSEYRFTEKEDQIYLEQSWKNFKRLMKDIEERVYSDLTLCAVGGHYNFRKDIYDEYKLNRHADPSKSNKFVPVLRKRAIEEGLAVEAVGREADDLLRIWSNEAYDNLEEAIICSIDKDLLCIPGLHYRLKEKIIIKVTAKEAMRHYFEQIICGDSTDNIPGLPGIGKVKAAKCLEGCETLEDYQENVVGLYMNAYGDDWKSYLLCNGKMIHIQNHINDFFEVSSWPIVQELS